jgi:hypothetical protein
VNRPDPKTLLVGLIVWMRRESIATTRTRLMKFLYLADLHHARHHGGETVTGWRWRVDAYGPLVEEAYRLFERGEAEGWLFASCPGERDDERGHKAVFYEVAPGMDVGDALLLVGKVRKWMRELGDDTGKLLRFVYGPLASRPLSRKDEKRFKELSERLQARYEAARTANRNAPQGPRDAAYIADLPEEDEHMNCGLNVVDSQWAYHSISPTFLSRSRRPVDRQFSASWHG